MRFRDGLGRYIGDGREFFHNDDEWYKDIKCYDVCFSENDRNYIGVSNNYDIRELLPNLESF